MASYIDLHNHILPEIDDGPSTMEEAVQLARDLVASGYGTIVATPHALEGDPHPALICSQVEELQEELDRLAIPLKILPGAEQHIDPELPERLRKNEVITLNRSRYLLLELPMLQPLPVYTEQLLFSLVQDGYRPVIPHPERVMALQVNHQMLFKLHRIGALFQVTWAAFLGLLGPAAAKTARYMLEAGLVHFLSTDAHHPGSDLLSVEKAADLLDNRQGEGYSEMMLTERPRLLLENQPLDLPEPRAPGGRPPSRVPFLARLFRV